MGNLAISRLRATWTLLKAQVSTASGAEQVVSPESELSLAQVTGFNRRSDVNSSIKKMMGEESTYTGLHSQANNRKSHNENKYFLLQSILAHKNTISGICCKNEGYLVTASLDHSLKVDASN